MDNSMALLRRELEKLPSAAERAKYLASLGWINPAGAVRADLPESVYAGLLDGVPTEAAEIEAKWNTLASELQNLSKPDRFKRLQQLGYFDGFQISPAVPAWVYEDQSLGEWDTSRLQTEVAPSAGRDAFLREVLSNPDQLRKTAQTLELRGDQEGAAKLREHLKTELEQRYTVGKETLTFRRVESGEHEGQWKVVTEGNAYLTPDPETFAVNLAAERQRAADLNEDGIKSSELSRIELMAAGGDVPGAIARYCELALAHLEIFPVTPGQTEELLHDSRYRGLFDRAAYFAFRHSTPGFRPSEAFSEYVQKNSPGRFTVERLRQLWQAFNYGSLLDGMPEPPKQEVKVPFSPGQLSRERIGTLSLEEISEIEADPDLVSLLGDDQISSITDRRSRLLRQGR